MESALSVSMDATSHRRELGASLQVNRSWSSRHLTRPQIILTSRCAMQVMPWSSDHPQRGTGKLAGLMGTGHGHFSQRVPEALPAAQAALSCLEQVQGVHMMQHVVQQSCRLLDHVTRGTAAKLEGDRACRVPASSPAAQPDLPCCCRTHASAKGSEHSVATSPRPHRRVTSCCRQSLWRSGTVMDCRAR